MLLSSVVVLASSKWQLLRTVVHKDGTLVPDRANVDRLRDCAASLMTQDEPEHYD